VDAEQIRHEMSVTRASIDRKLDALGRKAETAKRKAARQLVAAASILTAMWLAGRWWSQYRARKRRRAPAQPVLRSA
jgi:hypothetical protein